MTDGVDVAWVSLHAPKIIPRGYWDQALLEDVLSRDAWRPAGAREIRHRIVTGPNQPLAPSDLGAVVVVPARHHASDQDVHSINRMLDPLAWVVLILTGDEANEFPWRKVEHRNIRMWMTHPPEDAQPDHVYLGSGYPPHLRPLLAGLGRQERTLDWFFAGQVNHDRRRRVVEQLRDLPNGVLVETPGFTQGLEHDVYAEALGSAKVVPCPAGKHTPDTFRAFEALEAGCIPIVDVVGANGNGAGFWEHVFGGDDHWLTKTYSDWDLLQPELDAAVANFAVLGTVASARWQQHKRRLAHRLEADIDNLTGMTRPRNRVEDLVTVVIPTSPIPSNPDTRVIDETVASIRSQDGLGDCEIIIVCDGVRPEQQHLAGAYDEYLQRLLWKTNHEWHNVVPVVSVDHQHQANMARAALDLAATPLVLFVEHDTPLVGDIPWAGLVKVLRGGMVDVIRLHHEASILAPHKRLMLDETPIVIDDIPLLRTTQWSQRPHLATTAWYRRILTDHFPPSCRTMIEDQLYGIVENEHRNRGMDGWSRYRVTMYAPDGDMKRSTHLDGRDGEPKYDMRFG